MKADGAITWLGGHRRLVFRLVLLWLFMCSAAATALIVLMRGNCDVFEVHRHEITAPRWGSGAPRLRVAVLADFHVRPTPEDLKRLERIVAAANAEAHDPLKKSPPASAGSTRSSAFTRCSATMTTGSSRSE